MSTTPLDNDRLTMPPLQLATRLYDHYETIDEVRHYYGVLAIYALVRTAEIADDAELMERCRRILSGFPVLVTHPRYNFPSYAIGGIARAYALFRGHMGDEVTRGFVHAYALEMLAAARDRKGLMCRPRDAEAECVWIDVAMAATPYLLFAGLAMDEQRFVDEAVRQACLHHDEFLDPANNLVHQCRGFLGYDVYTPDHWGRGNGWMFLALTELVQYLPSDSPHRPEAEQRFAQLARALLPHQSPRGMWRQEIPLASAWEESSGTGLFAYGFGIGLRRGVLEEATFGPALDRAIEALRTHCINPDFSTEWSCPGCLCPGKGDIRGTIEGYLSLQPRRDEPHGAAPIMLALTEQALRKRAG